ncbi:MAG TPA: acetyl-CoA carboxylase biotin carboxyl carrier protein [Candidatus Baltobacteraceae bacterium]|nr:acetyl-CoA carboxylase biotin carboxyl carrier protein [Candidatus Baltobacteraceae bacterium]HTZ72364.1 acetyl-CoA carboxylase biotin carboxyl carrier protein [Candidatus Aquilonibacter sp.]
MAKKTKQQAGRDFVGSISLSEIERLLAFMQKHGLEEFEYQQGDVHIRLKKAAGGTAVTPAAASAPAVFPPPASAEDQPVAAVAPSHTVPVPVAEDLHIVKSPIVGTFYAAASPDADPFVTVGSRVQSGQVLCIIEAMKLMNEIEADASGEIARIFVENGHPVEYGEPLFGIRTGSKR